MEHPYVPNDGFYEDVVFASPSLLSTGQAFDSVEGGASVDDGNGNNNEGKGDVVHVRDAPVDPASIAQNDMSSEVIEQVTSDLDDLNMVEKVSAQDTTTEDQILLSAEDVDALLDKCLLQALHTSVKDKDLPMPGSILWYDKYSTTATYLKVYGCCSCSVLGHNWITCSLVHCVFCLLVCFQTWRNCFALYLSHTYLLL